MQKATVFIVAMLVLPSVVFANGTDPWRTEVEQLKALTAKGVLPAELCLSSMYSEGVGVKRNDKLAQYYFAPVVAEHDTLNIKVAAFVSKMISSRSATEWSRGKAELVKFALQGNGYAQSNIGIAYLYGAFGWPQNYSKARYWLRKSALQNSPDSQLFLAAMYAHGWGVHANEVQARKWLDKAIKQQTPCPAVFVDRSFMIAIEKVKYPKNVSEGLIKGYVTLRFHDLNGKAVDVKIVKGSGYPELDEAALAAMRGVSLPGLTPDLYKLNLPWTVGVEFAQYRAVPDRAVPDSRSSSSQIIGLVGRSTYRGKVQQSIRSALVFPFHVLVYGSNGTGRVTVSFYLKDGHASQITVVKSSQDKYEDAAVIAAIKNAQYPPTPRQTLGREIPFSITIQFQHYSQAPASHTLQTTSSATLSPSAVTHSHPKLR